MNPNHSEAGDQICCPFLDQACLRGNEQAGECNGRVHADFNPLQNYRDFMILCCANERRQAKDKPKNTGQHQFRA